MRPRRSRMNVGFRSWKRPRRTPPTLKKVSLYLQSECFAHDFPFASPLSPTLFYDFRNSMRSFVRAAFLTMAAEIKNRMAVAPQQDTPSGGPGVVKPGEKIAKAGGGGGCC